MSIEVAIVELVRKDAQCERQLRGRYFPGTSGQDSPSPYLAYHLLNEDEGYTLSGPDGTPRARLQLEVWATDPDARSETGRKVKDCLNGFRGWSATVFIKKLKASFAGDDEEEAADGYWYRRRIEVEADYDQQPAPRRTASGR